MEPAINCKNEIFSPSNNPQKIATIGIKYVTEEEKIGVEICTNLLYIILDAAVPKIARIAI